ncbi:DUF397 domain-containing protein [Streptomyces sp. NPDC048110]|uniref:DUF397 domain-containing protein n=1 Tax=Streptomyces sp. NPDC048110 TaxID=3155483 RepID=UPI0033C6D8CE
MPVRDNKNPAGPILTLDAHAWQAVRQRPAVVPLSACRPTTQGGIFQLNPYRPTPLAGTASTQVAHRERI